MTEPTVTTEGSNSDSVEVAGVGTPVSRIRKLYGMTEPTVTTKGSNSDSVKSLKSRLILFYWSWNYGTTEPTVTAKGSNSDSDSVEVAGVGTPASRIRTYVV